jgi:hypothetical protein
MVVCLLIIDDGSYRWMVGSHPWVVEEVAALQITAACTHSPHSRSKFASPKSVGLQQ